MNLSSNFISFSKLYSSYKNDYINMYLIKIENIIKNVLMWNVLSETQKK